MTTAEARPLIDRLGISVRPVDAADALALRDFYAALSFDSRHRRFLGCSATPGVERSRVFCSPDHEHAEGFVAVRVTKDQKDGRLVGHLCLEADGDGGCELAVAVADAYQGHGTGQRLFDTAIAWARAEGIRRISATAYADNTAVLRLLRSAPFGATIRGADSGLVEVEIPLFAA